MPEWGSHSLQLALEGSGNGKAGLITAMHNVLGKVLSPSCTSLAYSKIFCFLDRGFGTVRYKNREEALQAAEMMNNTEIGGRVVSVRIDRFA